MILTVDPGLVQWAYAVFNDDGGIEVSSTVVYKSSRKLTQEQRLSDIQSVLSQKFNEYQIDIIISERQFVDIMAQITGVIRCVAGANNTSAVLYTPAQWKKAATGKGNISEADLREKVLETYPQLKDRTEHEIDCAGIYLAHKKKASQ